MRTLYGPIIEKTKRMLTYALGVNSVAHRMVNMKSYLLFFLFVSISFSDSTTSKCGSAADASVSSAQFQSPKFFFSFSSFWRASNFQINSWHLKPSSFLECDKWIVFRGWWILQILVCSTSCITYPHGVTRILRQMFSGGCCLLLITVCPPDTKPEDFFL